MRTTDLFVYKFLKEFGAGGVVIGAHSLRVLREAWGSLRVEPSGFSQGGTLVAIQAC